MVEIRFITEDEIPAYRRALELGFGSDVADDDDEGLARFRAISNLETTQVALDHDQIVATFSSFDLDLTVPGGSLAAAGTTHVTVQPTHRRRGILSGMMRRHLQQAIDRGQPMAALWASEEEIYGRFGYGVACFGNELTIPARTIALPAPAADLTVRRLDDGEAATVLPSIYGRALPDSPGFFARSAAWWTHRHLRESKDAGGGVSRRRFVIVERAGDPVGYVTYRQRRTEPELEEGRTEIVELVALDDDARRALWSYITNVDLYRTVTWWNAPLDEPLYLEASRFRTLQRTVIDSLWLRPLDVPRVLEARTYERSGSVVIEVGDTFLDRGGRFRLDVSDGRAQCRPTTERAALELDISDLGAAYLGGSPVHRLARAGRVSGAPEAVNTLNDLLATRRLPFCIEVF